MFTKHRSVASEELTDACYHCCWGMTTLQQNQQGTAETQTSIPPPHGGTSSGKSGFVRGVSQIAD